MTDFHGGGKKIILSHPKVVSFSILPHSISNSLFYFKKKRERKKRRGEIRHDQKACDGLGRGQDGWQQRSNLQLLVMSHLHEFFTPWWWMDLSLHSCFMMWVEILSTADSNIVRFSKSCMVRCDLLSPHTSTCLSLFPTYTHIGGNHVRPLLKFTHFYMLPCLHYFHLCFWSQHTTRSPSVLLHCSEDRLEKRTSASISDLRSGDECP